MEVYCVMTYIPIHQWSYLLLDKKFAIYLPTFGDGFY